MGRFYLFWLLALVKSSFFSGAAMKNEFIMQVPIGIAKIKF